MNKWIPVTERYPDDERDVLVYTRNGGTFIDNVSNPKDGNIWAAIEKSIVTYWCELPEPPLTSTSADANADNV